MKRTLLAISLCALALSASAQFKVQSTGTYYITCETGGRSGINLTAQEPNGSSLTLYGGVFNAIASTKAVGLQGYGTGATTSIGLLGSANYGTKSIGVLGSIPQSNVTRAQPSMAPYITIWEQPYLQTTNTLASFAAT